jgi:DUF4097 and DUF4098 domain-containing protein YvlB
MSERTEHTFPVETPARLVTSNIRGTISVEAHEADEIRVVAVKHLDSGNPDYTDVKIEQFEDGLVRAVVEFPDRWNIVPFRKRPCKVDLNIFVPQNCDVRLSNVSARCKIEGVHGKFKLRTVSGKLLLKELHGDFYINSTSAKVEAERLRGPLEMKLVSGRARMKDIEAKSIMAKTVSGDVLIETTLEEGPYTFKSVSGNIKLVVPNGMAISAQGRGISGDIRTSMPANRIQRYGRRWAVDLNGGGQEVSFNTISGDLILVNSEKETAGRPYIVRMTKAKRMDLLQKLESGEASVDETLAALRLG